MKFTDFHNSELAEAAKTRNATRDFLRNNPVSPDQMAKPVKQMSVPEFDPRMAKMAYDEGVVKGVSLQDGVTLERATAINDWHTHDGGMYKKYFAKGFKAGRMNKINHDNKQYNLNLKLMKDGSVSHGEQGVAEGTGSNSRALKIAEKIWAKYGSPKNEDRIYPENLIDLVDAAAGGRTYFFRSEIEAVPGVKTIMASINGGKFYDRAKFDKGVAILLKAAPKSRFGESAEQGVAETNVSKYADLGATNDTTHFIKNITTGKIVSPHRGRQDAEDALVANMRDSDDEFKIVRARKKQGVAESAGGPSWPEVISALTQGYPDIDPTDALKPLMQKYRVSYDYFDKLAQQQGYKDLFDAYAEFEELPTTGPTMSKGVAEDTDPLLHIKKLSGL